MSFIDSDINFQFTPNIFPFLFFPTNTRFPLRTWRTHLVAERSGKNIWIIVIRLDGISGKKML
jgi:hypothetical protein